MSDSPTDESATDGRDYRQFSVVVLAALALVLAAFFAPGMAGQGRSIPDAEPGQPDADIDPNSLPDIDIDWRKLLEWFDWDETETEEIEPGDQGPDSSCLIRLNGDPIPGSEVTAMIYYEGEPLAGVPVWFNDRRVGETDDLGRVTGEVPYVNELVVRIGADDHPACTGVEDTARSSAVTASARSSPLASSAIGGSVGAGLGSNADIGATGMRTEPLKQSARSMPTAASTGTQSAENGTVEYEVDGEVEIAVRGPPDPGETVTVAAAIEGVPMADAAVTIDGDQVTETDDEGTAAIDIPDDGTDAFELGVARGDFAGTTTVDVRLLEASLSPDGLAPIPGSPGVVEATIADEPVEGAEVRVGDELLGTTDEDGRLAFELPRDPRTTVTVSTADRTATVSLIGAYADVALVLALVVAGLAAVTYRTRGVRGPITVVGATAALLAVLTVEAFYGPLAGGVALLAVAAIAVGIVLRRSDRSITSREPPSRDGLRRFLERCIARVLALVAVLERAIDRARSRLGAARAWLASLPRSATALGERLATWLAALPKRGLARARRGLERLRRLPPARIAAILGAGPVIAGGYLVDGRRGAALVALLLGILAVGYWRGTNEDETDERDGEDVAESTAGAGAAGANTGTDDQRSFRELWRAFAHRVDPRRWHRRTPGEIQRDALEQGYPRRPVSDLTTLFREVEYGRRPLSSGIRDRADEAYTELTRARDEAESDGSGEPTAGPASGDGSAAVAESGAQPTVEPVDGRDSGDEPVRGDDGSLESESRPQGPETGGDEP